MSHLKINDAIKLLAVFSFFAIAIEYWNAGATGLALLLSPYVVLYYFSSNKNYSTVKLAVIRIIPAIIVFLVVPGLLFGVEPDAQAGIGLMLAILIQLAAISTAELIILFFIHCDNCS